MSDDKKTKTADKKIQPLSIALKNVSYIVSSKKKKTEKVILREINGRFSAGKVTAILGSSGAGKTTLLNIVAGKTEATGSVLINGQRFQAEKMKKISGFVSQEDILLETSTVDELLRMSAVLRLPSSLSAPEVEETIDGVVGTLMLDKCRNTVVGEINSVGLSGGERKRASIGMEMITNPPILILDEPTSGLDTFTAYVVVKKLKEIAQQGRTVISTIHQPSSDTFHLFDEIVLMIDGSVVYWGPTSQVISYFAGLGFVCPTYTNPADYFFMELLNGETEGVGEDAIREKREKQREIISQWRTRAHSGAVEEEFTAVKYKELKRTVSFLRQYLFLQARSIKNVLRNKRLSMMKLFQAVFIGTLGGMIFAGGGKDGDGLSVGRVARGCIFFMSTNQVYSPAGTTCTVFAVEKRIFEKEFHAGYYKVFPYYLSKVISELPVQILTSATLSIILHVAAPLRKDLVGFVGSTFFLCMLSMNSFMIGLVVSACFSDPLYSTATLPLVIFPLILTGGLFGKGGSVFSWLRYVSPYKYAVDSIMTLEIVGRKINGTDITEIALEADYTFDNLLVNFFVLAGFIAALFLLGFAVLFATSTRKRV
ncbi:MAG: ABC transporter superfamily protein [Amphiamblys sp. WSBS2006]|nr:MAG: ABC transporter superfamily protein [Amphiamblys sp. WSBS2006]